MLAKVSILFLTITVHCSVMGMDHFTTLQKIQDNREPWDYQSFVANQITRYLNEHLNWDTIVKIGRSLIVCAVSEGKIESEFLSKCRVERKLFKFLGTNWWIVEPYFLSYQFLQFLSKLGEIDDIPTDSEETPTSVPIDSQETPTPLPIDSEEIPVPFLIEDPEETPIPLPIEDSEEIEFPETSTPSSKPESTSRDCVAYRLLCAFFHVDNIPMRPLKIIGKQLAEATFHEETPIRFSRVAYRKRDIFYQELMSYSGVLESYLELVFPDHQLPDTKLQKN